ncbi:MAG: hypothetical protein E6Q97_22230 [Desulfurellales bacterium]|nr:MAG: hypothetical protein E6Q97_22230 [Desulfurellales bacterium]
MDYFPNAQDFNAARVTVPGQSEIIQQSLYDFNLYAGAGQTSLTFFQNPIGAGLTTALGATAGTVKTKADTNMQMAAQLPSGIGFLAESIEIYFNPGSVSTASTFTIDTLTFFLAAASAVPTAQVDDVSAFTQSGSLEFNILQKNYLREAPLGRFPPKVHTKLNAAIASNSATTAEVGVANAYSEGRPMYVGRIGLQPAMNFEVKMEWPGLVAMTSGFNARVGVVLDGYMMRAVQ